MFTFHLTQMHHSVSLVFLHLLIRKMKINTSLASFYPSYAPGDETKEAKKHIMTSQFQPTPTEAQKAQLSTAHYTFNCQWAKQNPISSTE